MSDHGQGQYNLRQNPAPTRRHAVNPAPSPPARGRGRERGRPRGRGGSTRPVLVPRAVPVQVGKLCTNRLVYHGPSPPYQRLNRWYNRPHPHRHRLHRRWRCRILLARCCLPRRSRATPHFCKVECHCSPPLRLPERVAARPPLLQPSPPPRARSQRR